MSSGARLEGTEPEPGLLRHRDMSNESAGSFRRYDGWSGSVRMGGAGLLFTVLALTACDTPAASVRRPTAVPTATPASTAKARVDCGTYVLSQGEDVPEAAYRCFIEAVESGRPARLKETKLTVEGDPIPVSYVGDAKGRVERTTDSRKDSFGTPGVLRHTCTGPTLAKPPAMENPWMEFANCSNARLVR